LSKHRRRSELAAKWWLASLAGWKETRAHEFEFPKGGGVSGLLKACRRTPTMDAPVSDPYWPTVGV